MRKYPAEIPASLQPLSHLVHFNFPCASNEITQYRPTAGTELVGLAASETPNPRETMPGM